MEKRIFELFRVGELIPKSKRAADPWLCGRKMRMGEKPKSNRKNVEPRETNSYAVGFAVR